MSRRSLYEDRRTINFSDYELWIVVNHPLFTDERCWHRARTVISRELGNRCAVDLNIYAKSDHRVVRAQIMHDQDQMTRRCANEPDAGPRARPNFALGHCTAPVFGLRSLDRK